ncbi:MAG: tetratricopeptide repeat protein [Candidatus Acidiferrales bacterium]
MRSPLALIAVACLAPLALAAPLPAQTPATQQQQPDYIHQGQQLMREGRLDDALALYRATLKTSPNSVPANIAAGIVLDLQLQGDEARQYFTKAINAAYTPELKAVAQRMMAMSYAFESDCKNTGELEQQVFDYYGTVKNFSQQGEIANEAGRVCLESGDLDAAQHWYVLAHDTGLKESNIPAASQDLWEFRWESAQARISIRRDNSAEAQKHVATAKSILEKGTNPEQTQYLPYLDGYVAFYTGDYKTALAEFQKIEQNEPFIVCILAQTYEKLGDKTKALELYRKASTAILHNASAAYALPLAKKKLASLEN